MGGLAVLAVMVAGLIQGQFITKETVEADWARQDQVRGLPGKPTPAADAVGGCDGTINGLWGFHTACEKQPWWQVDLGGVIPVDRIRIYNRCDALPERTAHLQILFSEDGISFRTVYEHGGTVFYGYKDSKPLDVALNGERSRFVRIQLPGTDYLHLDEVEVFAAGASGNVALGKAATQSSVSQWSAVHKAAEPAVTSIETLANRGRALAGSLATRGVDVQAEQARFEAALTRAREAEAALTLAREAKDASEAQVAAAQAALAQARLNVQWPIREMALRNPLLNFDEILFVKRAPTLFPHISDQYYGWFSRPGGGIYILSGFKGPNPKLRCLTDGWPEGNFLRPDLSYDGKKVLFSWCRFYPGLAEGLKDKTNKENHAEDAHYHIYEMNIDGTGVRRLTRGWYDDFDARYLPQGDIVFGSTRKGTALQADRDSAGATCVAALGDSYVRCGGDKWRPVPVFTLHRMNIEGGNLCAISAFENFEWTPAIGADGQVLYARWDYIDRFNGHFMSLWATHPDGTNAQLVYGNFTARPQCVFEARPIPDSRKLVFTASAHHSITGGSLVLLDRARGTEFEAPLTRITPDICFPETEGSPTNYYAGPWPLSEEHFLVSWSDKPLPLHAYMKLGDKRNPPNPCGIYLYDAFGNLNLLYRERGVSCETPIPVKSRPRPPVIADQVDWNAPKQGVVLLQDVYRGLGDVPRGAIARLRVVGVIPKVQPFMNQPVLGVSAEDTGKFVLGTVPVEPDGSAHFLAPSGIPVFFQAIDQDGMALRTMRSLAYVQPGQTLGCVGCHESRDSAPAAAGVPLALRHPPSKLCLEPEGAWPLRYDTLVQPVLDSACISCHRPGAPDAKAAAFDLTMAKSYESILTYAENDLHNLAFEKDQSITGDCPARKSKLLALLTNEGGHAGVQLEPASLYRLIVWMDTYAYRQGAFSPEQEAQLVDLRQSLNGLLTN
jgi:hypothetical protein